MSLRSCLGIRRGLSQGRSALRSRGRFQPGVCAHSCGTWDLLQRPHAVAQPSRPNDQAILGGAASGPSVHCPWTARRQRDTARPISGETFHSPSLAAVVACRPQRQSPRRREPLLYRRGTKTGQVSSPTRRDLGNAGPHGIATGHQTRPLYSPVRVSISILSPMATKMGTGISAPVEILAGLRTLPDVSPFTAGSV